MARPIWKGSISFGLVNVPVQLISAVRDQSVHFHLLTKDGHCRLRQKLYCPETKKEYSFSETSLGYEISPNNYVILDKAELASLKPESGDTIDIISFVNLDEIDPVYFDRAYYLQFDTKSGKSYQLLHRTMRDASKVAIAKFVMRQKGYLAVIRPLENILCLETMHFANEVTEPNTVLPHSKTGRALHPAVEAKELKIATQLLESMTDAFHPSKFKDEYSTQVLQLIDEKAKGHKVKKASKTKSKDGGVINIMDALKKSLSQKNRPKKSAVRKTGSRRA